MTAATHFQIAATLPDARIGRSGPTPGREKGRLQPARGRVRGLGLVADDVCEGRSRRLRGGGSSGRTPSPRNDERKPCGTAATLCSLTSFESDMSESAFVRGLGNKRPAGAGRRPAARSRSPSSRNSTVRRLGGTQCSPQVFMRVPGMAQTAASRSTPPQVARRTSAERAAVNTRIETELRVAPRQRGPNDETGPPTSSWPSAGGRRTTSCWRPSAWPRVSPTALSQTELPWRRPT